MIFSQLAQLLTAAALVSTVQGQAQWPADQVNTTLCQWVQPRAALLQDTVYLDGGTIWWTPGLKNGQLLPPESDDNPLGIIFTLNFSKPFKTSDNITALFEPLSKARGGAAANNFAPNYVDGAILANDHEWFLYGGLVRETAEFKLPGPDEILGYRESSYGLDKPAFMPGYVDTSLPDGVTRYVAYGGAANVPSENKAFYFSGLRAPDKGEVFQTGGSVTANVTSDTLIVLDMTTQLEETWKNITLPSNIKGRANPELVWVPVGKQGILVSLGGVIFPDFSDVIAASPDPTASKTTSPLFMSTIDVYDIASGEWFSQPTKDGPGQLTRGCAVVATAQDYSSFNIYYYGGYDGLSSAKPFNDDVWVLSLPSFTWTKVAEGTGSGRAGHKCFMPYPDRFMAIGGYTTRTGTALTCLKETIRVFDVNTAQWLDQYDPSKWSNYSIPDAIVKVIGGTATGGAKLTAPSGGWEDDGLGDIFGTKYPTERIKTYYPYEVAQPKDNTNPNVPNNNNNNDGGGSGVPSFLPPVLGVVLGLMFLTMIAVLILLWRRRKLLRRGGINGGRSEAGTEDTNRHRVMNWMRGQTSEAKAPTVSGTSEYNLSSPADVDSSVDNLPPPVVQPPNMAEIMGREIRQPVELMDTSPPVELHDTGLSHVDVMNRYSHLGQDITGSSLNNPSAYSHTSQIDHASSLSRSSTSVGGQHGFMPFDYRPDSDLLGNPILPPTGASSAYTTSPVPALATVSETEVATHNNNNNNGPSTVVPPSTNPQHTSRVLSGISNLSERDRAHLRQISDTSVSSVTTHLGGDRILYSPEPGSYPQHSQQTQTQPEQQPLLQQQQVVASPGPVSPPTAGGADGVNSDAADYMTARPTNSPPQGATQTAQPTVVVSPLGELGPPPPLTIAGGGAGGGGGGDGRSGSPPSLRRSVFFESREDMNDDGPAPPLPK
ncbi:hypothetical protein V8F33_002139 [Rhypophila sp. PSN 637]